MTDKEIVQALRICATHIEKGCGLCPQMKYVRCTERLADESITMIERLTDENAALREKQRWIPVAERLPERDVQVLGWYKDNPFSQYRHEVVAWNGNGWVFVYAHRYVTNVTHWMPLPKAPEEGDT